MNAATCRALDAVASEAGKRKINSSYRDPSRNSRVGGASRSMHMSGRAFDVQGCSEQFLISCVKHGFTGFGVYGNVSSIGGVTSTHVDTGNARTWGPNRRSNTTPGWLLQILKKAGWHPGKKPLQNIPTNAGTPKQLIS